jgi:hypothetical protein
LCTGYPSLFPYTLSMYDSVIECDLFAPTHHGEFFYNNKNKPCFLSNKNKPCLKALENEKHTC